MSWGRFALWHDRVYRSSDCDLRPNQIDVEILVHATEDALFLRWQELRNGPTDKPERATMNASTDDLLAIKLRKLDWPG